MTSSWREMTLAAALAIGFSAHAHNCDPLVFLSLKVGSKTIAVTEAQLSALPQRVIVTCRIPDDCIDSKRYPLFIARAVLQELIESLQATGSAKPC